MITAVLDRQWSGTCLIVRSLGGEDETAGGSALLAISEKNAAASRNQCWTNDCPWECPAGCARRGGDGIMPVGSMAKIVQRHQVKR